jgi:tetratricopeptide (TPR) repeat protein
VASSLEDVGVTREFQGDNAGAEQLFRQALQIHRKELRPGHPSIVRTEVRLGEALTEEGKLDQAEPLLSDAVKSAHHSPFLLLSWQLAEADSAMAGYLIRENRLSQAESLLRGNDVGMKNYPQAAIKRRILQKTARDLQLAEASARPKG